MEELLEKLKEVFLDEYGVTVGKNSTRIFEKLAELCNTYNIDVEELAGTWLAYAATHKIEEIKYEVLNEFEKRELSNRKETVSKPAAALSDFKLKSSEECKVEVFGQSSVVDLDSDNEMDDIDGSDVLKAYGISTAYAGTPKIEKKPATRLRNQVGDTPKGDFSPAGYSPAVQSLSTSYAARQKAGDTVLRYKCKDSDYWNDMSEGQDPPIKIVPVFSTKSLVNSKTGFKYMFQRTEDLAAALNAVIVDIGYDMIEEDEKELQDLRVSSVEEGWYLGRIRSEDGRLSHGNTFFEGDLDISGGQIVSLDLTGAEEYRLFPGQVVLMKGKNEMSKLLRVSEVAVSRPLPLPLVTPKNTRPINVIVASGPYTPIDSMQYEPLKDLIGVIKKDAPDVCILAGPFIDPSHPMILNGELADTFKELFEKILDQLKQAVSDSKTQIVIISSCKDAHHHAVYPTPPYFTKSRDNITILPDPAMFEVAGITIGFTSVDVLKHLANNEIAKSTITDRMGGLSKLILSQRNFYPLYPPDESVPLDVQLWKKHCRFTKSPHILVLPSDLRYFIKEVEGTILINPERLTKGRSGGTFARFQVKLPDSVEETEIQSVADFCSGEIMKI